MTFFSNIKSRIIWFLLSANGKKLMYLINKFSANVKVESSDNERFEFTFYENDKRSQDVMYVYYRKPCNVAMFGTFRVRAGYDEVKLGFITRAIIRSKIKTFIVKPKSGLDRTYEKYVDPRDIVQMRLGKFKL